MVHRKVYCINTCWSHDNKIDVVKFRLAAMIGGVEEGYTEKMKKRVSSEFPNTPSVEVICIANQWTGFYVMGPPSSKS